MTAEFSAQIWAREQFGEAELGDKRLTRRAVKYAAAAVLNPQASIPQQCITWKDTKGAYRLFDSEEANFTHLLEQHWDATRQKASGTVLLIQDTTTLSFNHPGTQGLGPTTSGNVGLGMLLHSCLAVEPTEQGPRVLGLAHSQIWARQPRSDSSKSRKKVPESAKWSSTIQAIGQASCPKASFVHVGDAESDCWEALQAANERQIGFVLRACQDRRAALGHDPGSSAEQSKGLFDLVRSQAPLAQKWIYTRRRGQQEARCVRLHVSAVPVTLFAPKNWSGKAHRKQKEKPGPIRCWAVRVWEADPPEGVEPIEWVLLTNHPVHDAQAALEVAAWYSCRWLVEEYHKCLKTGCKVEERQLEDVGRLESLVAILSVVAVRLLQIKQKARQAPDTPAMQVVPEKYVQALCAYRKLPKTMSIKRFWIEVARLGGFLARKSDDDPGWLTTWRGWQVLEMITTGYVLGNKNRRCG